MDAAGHLASAVVYGSRLSTWRARAALGVGALAPDLVDKGIQFLGGSPHGRTVGHSLVVLLALALLWRLRSLRAAGAPLLGPLAIGVALHLFVDLADDCVEALQWSGVAFSGWPGWPLFDPDQLHLHVPATYGPLAFTPTVLELAVYAYAVFQAYVARQYTSESAIA